MSIIYITSEPMIIPIIDKYTLENFKLSGISCKNDTDNIIPAEKESILYTNISEGFFIMPINEPIVGPRIEIITIISIGLKKPHPYLFSKIILYMFVCNVKFVVEIC